MPHACYCASPDCAANGCSIARRSSGEGFWIDRTYPITTTKPMVPFDVPTSTPFTAPITVTFPALTEEDVRRIIREEVSKLVADMLVEHLGRSARNTRSDEGGAT